MIDDIALPPDRIAPDGAVIVMPLPLSVAKPIVQPGLTLLIAGRVTVIDAPGAL